MNQVPQSTNPAIEAFIGIFTLSATCPRISGLGPSFRTAIAYNPLVHASMSPFNVPRQEITIKTSKAVVNLKTGGKSSITFENIDNPTNPKGANNLGHLSDYLSVAKKIVKTSESKGKLPNSVSSQVGTIGYDGLVSAFSRILVSYDKYGKMPKYVYVKSLSGGKTKVTGNLNSKNTIGNLAAYLAASKNCEINDAKIKKLVTKLTKNCGTDKEKADAIFKYVRDAIGYSFYYNTKYGHPGHLLLPDPRAV